MKVDLLGSSACCSFKIPLVYTYQRFPQQDKWILIAVKQNELRVGKKHIDHCDLGMFALAESDFLTLSPRILYGQIDDVVNACVNKPHPHLYLFV